VEQAYRSLREAIVHGRLSPGSRIVETDVARRLGLSRTPVRSALQRLEQEGYVTAPSEGRQSRMSVAPLTEEDGRELFGIVGQLEALGARWSAELPEGPRMELVEALKELNRGLSRAAAAARPDRAEVFRLDTDFHLACLQGGGPRLTALHSSIKPQAERYIRLYVSALMEEIGTSVEEHEAIIEGIEMGSGLRTQRAVQTNWTNAADRLASVIRTAGERGSW